MTQQTDRTILIEKIFGETKTFKEEIYLALYHYQYEYSSIYQSYCKYLGRPKNLNNFKEIPFLPISLFKTNLISSSLSIPLKYFASSGTTGQQRSKHYITDIGIYEKSFLHNFKQTFGNPHDYSILGLLPSYLEQEESSLVYMVDYLIRKSTKFGGGFYLHNFEDLQKKIIENEARQISTILFGVTYALLDFAEAFPMPLHYCTIIETGGMKGRKKELTRIEVHQQLCKSFNLENIHSEYGMTELFAQSYSKGQGIYSQNDLLQICIREDDDPFELSFKTEKNKTGLLNIIDLSNIDSCSFIATDDIAVLYENGDFTIEGRADNSDIRGCSLLSL